MDIQTIISEADARIPNALATGQKVTWLNEVNNEFFDVVKIPKAVPFNTAANSATYVLANDIRAKNIEKVVIGKSLYLSYLNQDVGPGLNYHLFDDTAATLTLVPAPTTANVSSIVKYSRISTTTFLVGTLNASPDAPAEYHWVYILGLCEKMATAMDDIPRSSNYGQQYRAQLTVAQANYQRG